jgi:hypothetical protein
MSGVPDELTKDVCFLLSGGGFEYAVCGGRAVQERIHVSGKVNAYLGKGELSFVSQFQK